MIELSHNVEEFLRRSLNGLIGVIDTTAECVSYHGFLKTFVARIIVSIEIGHK